MSSEILRRHWFERVKHDREKRQAILDGIMVYQASNGRWCISDRKTHKYLPTAMGDWQSEVRWDFRSGLGKQIYRGCPLQYFFNTPPAQPNKYPYNNRIRFEIENNRGIHWIDNTVVVYLLKVVLHQCLIDVGARIYIYWFESHCPWGMRSPTSRMVCAVSSARISCPSKSFIQPLRMCSHSHSQGGTVLIVIVIVPPPLNLSGRQRVQAVVLRTGMRVCSSYHDDPIKVKTHGLASASWFMCSLNRCVWSSMVLSWTSKKYNYPRTNA